MLKWYKFLSEGLSCVLRPSMNVMEDRGRNPKGKFYKYFGFFPQKGLTLPPRGGNLPV